MNINAEAAWSVTLRIICGHIPARCRITDMNANVIRMLVTGNARMFVSRKYFGNVPKVSHARGPVNI